MNITRTLLTLCETPWEQIHEAFYLWVPTTERLTYLWRLRVGCAEELRPRVNRLLILGQCRLDDMRFLDAIEGM